MNKRPPRKVRFDILERDRYRCIDCRRPKALPPSELHVDHDIELADGGTNDDANQITRCIPHHKAKTEERRMARTDPNTKVKSKAATAVLPDRPGPAWSAYLGALLIAAGAWVGLTAMALDYVPLVPYGLVALLVGIVLADVGRYVHWRRVCEAQRVYERLSAVAGTPHAARKRRFKVKGWQGFTPVEVAIQPVSSVWVAGEKQLQADLALALGAAVDLNDVQVIHARAGWVRLRAGGESVAQGATHDASPAAPDDDGERAQSEDQLRALARVRSAVLGLISNGAAEVHADEWWDDARAVPRALTVNYDSGSTHTMRDARADVPTLLTDLFPPRARAGRWHVTFDPARDRFTARDEPDDLAPIVKPAPIEDDVDLVRGPVIGIVENGDEWHVPLLHSHALVAGATGAGKGSVLWGIIRGVSHMIRDGRVRLWVIDPKGGMELGTIEPLAHRFATGEGAAELLAEAATAMEEQAQRLRNHGLRKLETPTVSMPLHLIIVDELAALTSLAGDSRERNAMNATMGRLLTQGRAVGFCVVGALQDPRQKNLDNRNLFPYAIALRLKERQMVDMVLGAGARASGATCDLIAHALPGVGYVVADGQAETLRVRASFVSDAEVARVVAARTPAAHARAQSGEQLELEGTETRA